MKLHEAISEDQFLLLEKCIRADAPQLRHLLHASQELSMVEMKFLRDFAFNEMIKIGLEDDWEPNHLGAALDDLGGAINIAIINEEDRSGTRSS